MPFVLSSCIAINYLDPVDKCSACIKTLDRDKYLVEYISDVRSPETNITDFN